jgi:hypothetical protein
MSQPIGHTTVVDEQTALLPPQTRAQNRNWADGEGEEEGTDVSSQTLRDPYEGEEGFDRPNQVVGRTRGVLISFSLWGLIFLQGEFWFY